MQRYTNFTVRFNTLVSQLDTFLIQKRHFHAFLTCSLLKLPTLISIQSKYLNRSGLLTLYYSLVYPHLSYFNIVWASTFPTYYSTFILYSNKLHLIQKCFIRTATSSESTATSDPLFSKFKL